jgi:hypothetical protein
MEPAQVDNPHKFSMKKGAKIAPFLIDHKAPTTLVTR